MEFASHFNLPTSIFHIDPQLVNQLGNLLGSLLLSFILDSTGDIVALASMTSINELHRYRVMIIMMIWL
jgi:hypothetical protein